MNFHAIFHDIICLVYYTKKKDYLIFHLSLTSGNVYRECLPAGNWREPNFDGCVDESYENMLNEVSKIAVINHIL